MEITATAAVNRFGLGARPGELASVATDPRGWLLAQLAPAPAPLALAGLPGSSEYLAQYYDAVRARRARKQAGDAPMPGGGRSSLRRALQVELLRRQGVAVATADGFRERLVRFWSNHFAISVDKARAAPFAAPMEREAIRPNLQGRFDALLLAVVRHPGMLLYLDNAQSVGEDSRAALQAERRAQRKPDAPARKPGLNENLAREILELHTLGVDGGYRQDDVVQFARALTGWSVPAPREALAGASAFKFHAAAHAAGPCRVLGRTYAEAGEAQAAAILRDLALHPATANHLALKLARHFVADAPPPALVERMARDYLRSGGELAALYRSLVDADQAWTTPARKFKTPDDFVLSALRATGLADTASLGLSLRLQGELGQPVFQPRSPAGFGDVAADWSGPDALFKRVQAAQTLANRVAAGAAVPLQLGQAALGASLDGDTALALRRAESVQQGVALLLASPAFQWRA